jgi:hypothetical protein
LLGWVLTLALAAPPLNPVLEGSSSDPAPQICACGCGKMEGQCCCTAHRGTELSLQCADRSDPGRDSGGPIRIGPPRALGVDAPEGSFAQYADDDQVRPGCRPKPETPPPRA